MKPFKFYPILKDTLWGGDKISMFKRELAFQEQADASQERADASADSCEGAFQEQADASQERADASADSCEGAFQEQADASRERAGVSADSCEVASRNGIGESWEISGVPGNESVIADGELKGKTLTEAVAVLKDKLVGIDNYKRFGNDFPLLVKFIDARQDLSIQVHPNDEIAQRNGMKNGKTEMWYIMDSEPEAKLFSGLKREITPEEYTGMVENDTICDALAGYSVKAGDCFFIPAGRVHSIGAGCFLAEIQQTSDATYRIYDFKRKDSNGNYRTLHTREAAECIDYNVEPDYQTDYVPVVNQGVSLVRCAYFNTAVYDLDEPMTLDYTELDSFVIFIGVKGEGVFVDNEGNETTLREGETMLVPATTDTLYVTGTIKFLETYI